MGRRYGVVVCAASVDAKYVCVLTHGAMTRHYMLVRCLTFQSAHVFLKKEILV